MKNAHIIAWGYLIEPVCAGAFYGLLLHCVPEHTVSAFLIRISEAGVAICGAVLTFSSAAFFVLFQQSTTEFGQYLANKQATLVYLSAYAASILISAAGLIAFLLTPLVVSSLAAHVSGFLLLYTLLQLWSLIKNTYDLAWLHSQFETARRKAKREGMGLDQ